MSEQPRLPRHLLDDIKDRDAQTEPITHPEDLPFGRNGTKYDHARRQTGRHHFDNHTLALGDRHILLEALRALTRPLDVEAWAREIVLHDDQHHDTDHACAECIPEGEIVVPGFRCVPHEARAYLSRLSQPGGSDAE